MTSPSSHRRPRASRSGSPPPSSPRCTTLLGLVPQLGSGLVEVAAHSLDPTLEAEHLALWHGVTPALALSGLTLSAGLLLVFAGAVVAQVQARTPRPVDGDVGYRATIRALNVIADRVTGVVQSGSLPVYIGVILSTAVVVPGVALLRAPFPTDTPLGVRAR